MPGVKTDGDFLNIEDIDIGGKQVIQAFLYLSQWHWLCCSHMGNLGKGMHSRIGAACSLNFHLFSEYFSRRINQRVLNAPGILLRLPASVAGSIVLKGDFILMHYRDNTL
jgi:hypothetical protein